MIDIICGARPNFMKIDPVIRNLDQGSFRLVHTGQHYDYSMSQSFFEELGLPRPDINLCIGPDTATVQTARIMESYEKTFLDSEPEAVLVVGDVNSTLACALVAARHGVLTVHVEAGLRSFDRSMPEEVNRILTDQIADLLLITSPEASDNLLREGRPGDSIVMVGNPMIDTLMRLLPLSGELNIEIPRKPYCLITLHRPSNVDFPDRFAAILSALGKLTDFELIFPAHPRTMRNIDEWNMSELVPSNLSITPPMGYLSFIRLEQEASVVITDSGGVQEETSVLGVPCVTIRPNTERPITITMGTNVLCPHPEEIPEKVRHSVENRPDTPPLIPMWDGRSGGRIAEAVLGFIDNGG